MILRTRSLFLIIMLFLISSCNLSDNEKNEVSIQTINFENDNNNSMHFETNDLKYYNKAFWTSFPKISETPMTFFEVEHKKVSGSARFGSGITFCHSDSNNFKFFIISIDGSYTIGEFYSGNYYHASDYIRVLNFWRDSDAIKKGYNISNKLKVEWKDATFKFYINDYLVETVKPSNFKTQSTSGYPGLYTSIGTKGDEDFPKVPAGFKFNILQPKYVF